MSGNGSNSNNKKTPNAALSAQRFEQELANAPPDLQDKLRALLQSMALNGPPGAAAGSSGKEPKSMDEHKFWKTQPVVKHGMTMETFVHRTTSFIMERIMVPAICSNSHTFLFPQTYDFLFRRGC